MGPEESDCVRELATRVTLRLDLTLILVLPIALLRLSEGEQLLLEA